MQVRIDERATGEFVLALDGELDMATESLLAQAVTRLLARGGVDALVVDLADLQFMDSSGMRALLRARAAAAEQEAAFALARPRDHVVDVLRVAALDHILTVEDPDNSVSQLESNTE